MFAKSPVQAGGQPCVEAAPSVMGEEYVRERAVYLPLGPTHSATELFMNPNSVLDSEDTVVNKKDMIPTLEKLKV